MLLNGFQKGLIARACEAAKTAPACKLCNESIGGLNPEGKHNLCAELAKLNAPMPTWKRCTFCYGLKHIPISSVGPMNPSGKTMERWAPKCTTCDGKGYTNFDQIRMK